MERQEFIAALSEVMEEVGYIQKDAKNEHQRYRYASAEAVLNKVRGALASRDMAVESHASLEHFEVFDTDNGKRSIAAVKLSLSVTDGVNTATMEGLGEGLDAGDKAVMKANTAALKYAVASGFLISWGDDPEADPGSEEIGRKRQPSLPVEDPFSDDDPVAYEDAKDIVASMKGKQGVRELKQFFGHCQLLHMTWDQVRAFATEQGVDLLNGLNKALCIKLQQMIKQTRVEV